MGNRISSHGTLATELSLLSDESLLKLLSKAIPVSTGIGGESVLLEVGNIPIFVKKVRLTEIENRPENRMSTTNLFGLPIFCQYGVGLKGSPGFGAWRELAAHTLTTHWVLFGESPNFPLLYHWRILPGSIPNPTTAELQELEDSVRYWNESPAVRARLEMIQKSSTNLVLFLEYIPETLDKWLKSELAKGGDVAISSCKLVDETLGEITSFMKSRDFLHFDAHFRNILTDGRTLYFSDFGLATCTQFKLSKDEVDFFEGHRDYDRSLTVTNLANSLVTSLVGAQNRDSVLQKYAAGKEPGTVDPAVALILTRYSAIAKVMNEFYRKFQTETRMVRFPATELGRVCPKGLG